MTELLTTIAIPDLAGPASRTATLEALARCTSEPHQIVFLIEEGQPVPEIEGCRYLIEPAPQAIPAALNRLLAATETPYLLLLESGAIVTPGWLTRLLEPLTDPANGLSGPSTNRCWNEQQIALANPAISRDPDLIASQLARRYGNRIISLDTLHSLNDFCYLFKREVAVALGGFDEAYGVGPCWEIDFNTRAARSGWRAIWVPAAYVQRGPTLPHRLQHIRQLFTHNKQLYQDHFCGLRLQGQAGPYEVHCQGENCPHFAPPGQIRLSLPDALRSQAQTQLLKPELPKPPTPAINPIPHHSWPIQNSEMPMVSCIMPTRNRRSFLSQALGYWSRQTYPHRELIIIDDGNDTVKDLIPPEDERIRYYRLDTPLSIGEKRNLACQLAQGEIIAHWDDDDWYSEERLNYQVAPLLAGQADLTGLETGCFFDLPNWQAWTCRPELHRRLFVGDVHGGTLVYWKRLWVQQSHYPAISLAEDARFLKQVCARGARLLKLATHNHFVYLRHATNAWRLEPGRSGMPNGWQLARPEDFLPAEDLAFYATLRQQKCRSYNALNQKPQPAPDVETHPVLEIPSREEKESITRPPLVTCIMPTFNRRAWVPLAIKYFQRQDFTKAELLILDDGTDPVADLIPPDQRIRYVRLENKMILGAKRNLACQMALGEIIVHWDDDDWCAPRRLTYQLSQLLDRQADICGTGQQFYYDPHNRRAWIYQYPAALRLWLAGNTLCYRKTFWQSNPFPEISVGEDTAFIWNHRVRKAWVLPDYTFYVGLVHSSNTSPKVVNGPYWRPCSIATIEQLLGYDLAIYKKYTYSSQER